MRHLSGTFMIVWECYCIPVSYPGPWEYVIASVPCHKVWRQAHVGLWYHLFIPTFYIQLHLVISIIYSSHDSHGRLHRLQGIWGWRQELNIQSLPMATQIPRVKATNSGHVHVWNPWCHQSHTNLGTLYCHMGPWCHPGLHCCQGPCLDPYSYWSWGLWSCPRPMLPQGFIGIMYVEIWGSCWADPAPHLL